MKKQNLSNKIAFFYIIGFVVALLLSVLSYTLKPSSSFAILFPLVSLFTYLGVIIRGKIEPISWGKTLKKRIFAILVGFTSIFVIIYIESIALFYNYFESQIFIKALIFEGILLIIGYIILYFLYLKQVISKEQKKESF